MRHSLSILSVFAFFCVFGQQSTRYTQYMMNPMLVNPAAVGNTGQTHIHAGFRALFTGIEGAPHTELLSFESSLFRKKMGIGFDIQNDQAALLNMKKAVVNTSYRYRLGAKTWICLGAGVGIRQHVFDGTKSTFKDADDPALIVGNASNIKPVLNGGLFLNSEKATIGLSTENLVQYKIDYSSVDRTITSLSKSRIYLLAGYKFNLNRWLKFTPYIQYKYETKNPDQLDLTPMFELKEKYFFGGAYRYNESVSVFFQNQLTKSLKIGYAFDYQLNLLGAGSVGSHEFFIRYTIFKVQNIFNNPRFI